MEAHNKFKYIPELDGLRGASILVVLLHHTGMSLFRGGFIGVDIFFIISGFLITSILIKEYIETATINLKYFFLRRILRLLPLLVLVLAVYDAISFVLFREEYLTHLVDSLIALFYMTNWAWAFSVHPPDLLRHTWSLSIEEQFYLIWSPLLLLLLTKIQNRKHIVYLILALILASWGIRLRLLYQGVSVFRLYNGLDTRLDPLMTGAVLGIIYGFGLIKKKTLEVLSRVAKLLTPLAVIALLLICMKIDYRSPVVYKWIIAFVNVLGAVIIIDIVGNKKSILKSLLSMKWLIWIGKISYGLYLIHYPVFRILFHSGIAYKLIILLGGGVSIILASLSYKYFEKPFLNKKRKISYASV